MNEEQASVNKEDENKTAVPKKQDAPPKPTENRAATKLLKTVPEVDERLKVLSSRLTKAEEAVARVLGEVEVAHLRRNELLLEQAKALNLLEIIADAGKATRLAQLLQQNNLL